MHNPSPHAFNITIEIKQIANHPRTKKQQNITLPSPALRSSKRDSRSSELPSPRWEVDNLE